MFSLMSFAKAVRQHFHVNSLTPRSDCYVTSLWNIQYIAQQINGENRQIYQPEDVYIDITPNARIRYSIKSLATSLFPQDSIQKILLALTSRIAESHLIHEKRRILSMYRLFVLLLLKDLAQGLGNNWAFFIRDVIHSLLRIINEEKELEKRPRQHTQELQLVVDSDLFLPCCNLLYYVCKAAVECCSQVR